MPPWFARLRRRRGRQAANFRQASEDDNRASARPLDLPARETSHIALRGRARLRQALAWGIHFYTALGLAAGAGIAVLIVRGDADSYLWAFVLMVAATLIDATDGTLARAIRIKEVLPGFDGRRLDDLVDFLTYTALPLFLLWRAQILPAGQEAWLLVPLLASAYGFCQVESKTADGYFLGFPSYWNLIAFYLYMLHFYVVTLPSWLSLGLLLGFALLTLVPSRYLYPSQRGSLNRLTNVFACLWGGVLTWILYDLLAHDTAQIGELILWSLLFPAYYLAASWTISLRIWLCQGKVPRAA